MQILSVFKLAKPNLTTQPNMQSAVGDFALIVHLSQLFELVIKTCLLDIFMSLTMGLAWRHI